MSFIPSAASRAFDSIVEDDPQAVLESVRTFWSVKSNRGTTWQPVFLNLAACAYGHLEIQDWLHACESARQAVELTPDCIKYAADAVEMKVLRLAFQLRPDDSEIEECDRELNELALSNLKSPFPLLAMAVRSAVRFGDQQSEWERLLSDAALLLSDTRFILRDVHATEYWISRLLLYYSNRCNELSRHSRFHRGQR